VYQHGGFLLVFTLFILCILNIYTKVSEVKRNFQKNKKAGAPRLKTLAAAARRLKRNFPKIWEFRPQQTRLNNNGTQNSTRPR
jgi:hypothetical protein